MPGNLLANVVEEAQRPLPLSSVRAGLIAQTLCVVDQRLAFPRLSKDMFLDQGSVY